MRRIDLTFTALLVPLDFLALMGAASTAYSLRLSKAFTDVLRPLLQQVPLSTYLESAAVFALLWMGLFAISGLYSMQSRKAWSELSRVLLSCTAGTMVVIAIVFFRHEAPATSRFVVLAVWILSILYVSFFRLFLRAIRRSLLRARYGHQRIVVIGQDKTAQDLMKLYKNSPVLGYTVTKNIRSWTTAQAKEVTRLAQEGSIDGLLLADSDISKEQALEIIALAQEQHLNFRYLADLFAARISDIEISTVGGIPVIEVKRTPLDGWGRIMKRLFDILGSAFLLVIVSPIILVTALAIVLDSRGGVFFSRLPGGKPQERVGEGGKPFHYFKFRSMVKDQHYKRYNELAHLDLRDDGPLVKIKDDPRITRVGRVIRKWSIDELPELILVLLGRMSLVGPRPHYPEEVAKYQAHHRRVLAVKPGITGMAQISGRSDLTFEDEVRLDTWYIEHWSIWLDLYILLKTPMAVVSHRGVEEGV